MKKLSMRTKMIIDGAYLFIIMLVLVNNFWWKFFPGYAGLLVLVGIVILYDFILRVGPSPEEICEYKEKNALLGHLRSIKNLPFRTKRIICGVWLFIYFLVLLNEYRWKFFPTYAKLFTAVATAIGLVMITLLDLSPEAIREEKEKQAKLGR